MGLSEEITFSTWLQQRLELGLFTDSPFIFSKFLEIQDGSPTAQWLSLLV